MAGSDNTTTTQFRADISQFKAQFNDATRQIKLLNSEFQATASGMDNWKNSAEGVQAKLNQLNGVLTEQENQMESLQKQYQRTVEELGENSAEAVKLKTAINNQQSAINKTRREIENYNGEMQVMRRATYVAQQSGDDFETSLRNTRTAMKEAERTGNSFATELRNVQRANDLSRESGMNFRDSLNTVRQAMEQAERTGNTYETELEAVRRANEYAEQSGENFETSLDIVRQALEHAQETGQSYEDALADITREQDDADDGAQTLADGYTVLKDVVANLITEALAKAVDAFKEMASEGEEALSKLQASTGVSSEVMSDFGDVINNIYKSGMGESYSDVAEAVGLIAQNTDDLDPSNMQSLAENALYMRDTFDFDVAESIRAVNMLMDQFGITSDEAFNLIQQGAQNGLNKNGDLLDVINEYSVHFKQLGYDSDGFFNALVNGVDAGAWSVDSLADGYKELGIKSIDLSDTTRDAFQSLGLIQQDNSEDIAKLNTEIDSQKEKYSDLEFELRKAIDTQSNFNDETSELTKEENARKIAKIKDEMTNLETSIAQNTDAVTDMEKASQDGGRTFEEFSAQLAKGGTEGQEAMQEVLDALFAVEDETEKNRLGVEVFGTKWEDNGAKAMEAVRNTTGEIDGMNDSLEKSKEVRYDNAVTEFKSLGRTIKTEVIQPLVTELMPYAKEIVGYIMEHMPEIKATLSPIKDAIVGFVDYIINYLIPTIKDMSPLIAGVAVAIAGLGILGLIQNFGAIVTMIRTWAMSTKLMTAAQWLLNAAMNANPISLIVIAIVGLITALVLLYKKSETFREIVNNLWEKMKEFGAWLKEGFLIAWDAVVEFFTTTLPAVFNKVIDFIKNNWQALLLMLVNPFVGGFKLLYDNCEGFREFIDNFVESIKEFFVNGWNSIVTFFTKTVPKFKDDVIKWFKELGSKIWEWLTNAFNKVTTWATDMKNKATETAKEFVSNIITKVKELPGKIWDNIVGAVQKVKDWGVDLLKAGKQSAQDLFNGIVNKVKELPGEIYNIGSNLVEGLWNGINDMAGWVKSKISGFSQGVLDEIAGFFGVHSPSLVMENFIGKNLVLGLAKGIEENAKIAVAEMESLSEKTLEPIDKGVAVPVGYGSNAQGNVSTTNNYYNNFNQTNNSPKALSRLEIYRQSKNLFNYARGV